MLPGDERLSLPAMRNMSEAWAWLETPLGRSVIESQRRPLRDALADVFGFELLQIGAWGRGAELAAGARTQHRRWLAPNASGPGAVRARYEALPVASGSVEAVLLPHTLEYAPSPHELLREVERCFAARVGPACGFSPLGPGDCGTAVPRVPLSLRRRPNACLGEGPTARLAATSSDRSPRHAPLSLLAAALVANAAGYTGAAGVAARAVLARRRSPRIPAASMQAGALRHAHTSTWSRPRPCNRRRIAEPTPRNAALQRVEIYTDGACRGNPGPGGWGALLISGERRRELRGAEPVTTNNRMELTAAIEALAALKRPCRVRLYTDSQYLRNGVTDWLPQWKARGWKTADRKPVKNADLALRSSVKPPGT